MQILINMLIWSCSKIIQLKSTFHTCHLFLKFELKFDKFNFFDKNYTFKVYNNYPFLFAEK